MRTSKLRYKWNFLNGLMFQPTVAWDVFKMDMRYLSLKKLQVQPHVSRSRSKLLCASHVTAELLCHLGALILPCTNEESMRR